MKELFEQIREKEFYEVFGLSDDDGNYLEKLLLSSSIPVNIERHIHQRFYNKCMTQEEGLVIIEYLKMHQREPIRDGYNYQASDIKRKLKHGRDIK